MNLNSEQRAALGWLRASLMAGGSPLVDHSLIAQTDAVIAAAGTGSMIPVRAYCDGVIVSIDAQAYASGGDAEADTMALRMHEKYLAAQIKFGQTSKTNDTYEPLFLLAPKKVCWPIAGQTDLIQVTFKHLASAGVASLMGVVKFGFIPFEDLIESFNIARGV